MLCLTLPLRKKLSLSHAFRNRCVGFGYQGERFAHSAVFSRLNSITEGRSAVCCHARTFAVPLEPILDFACILGVDTPARN